MPFGDTPAFDRGIDRGVMMPVGELITSSLSNKGNATGFGQGNTFRVRDDQEVRITDNKGKVLFSGFGPEAARQAVALGQSITNEKGNKAGWMIQTGDRTINTDGSVGSTRWNDVAREKVNKSVISKIADVALPVAASFIPGVGPVLGAALGSAASSVAQGRSLENTLLRAGLSAGSAGIVGATGIDKALGGVLGDVGGTLAGKTAEEAAKQAAAEAGGQIVVTGLSKALQGAGGALGQAALSEAAKAGLSEITGFKTPAEQFTQQPTPEEIVVTGNVPTVTQGPDLGSALAGLPAVLGPLTADPALTGEAPSGNDGVLGTGLNVPQLLSIGGIGADLLGNLLGGSGGAGAGTPYVSQFGPGVGIGARQDMRANPTITDYERYGFGPEAMFFQPGYGLLSSATAPAPQAQPIMATNPRYEPLI